MGADRGHLPSLCHRTYRACPLGRSPLLVLRNILGFSTNDVAAMLDSTVEAVKSTLKQGHAAMRHRWASHGQRRSTAGHRLTG